jgi:putative Holliday junction resolvase
MTTGHVIALDLGDRHIGVAASDPVTGLVFPRPTIEINHVGEALNEIVSLVAKESPVALVVGYPLSLSGDVGPQAAKVETLVEQLRPRLACSVHLIDERLTTAGAKKTGHQDDHSYAARLILETYLAQQP